MSMEHIAVTSRLRPPAAFNGYLWWDFTRRHSVPPGFTYTRNSIKYVWNPTLNQYVPLAANVYAPDYDPLTGACRGYRAEQSQTNLVTRSSAPSVANGWEISGLSTAAATPIISGGSPIVVTQDTGNSTHSVFRSISVTAGQTYTFWWLLKYTGSQRYVTLGANTTGGNWYVNFDLQSVAKGTSSAGTATGLSADILDLGNGRRLVWAAVTVPSSGTSYAAVCCATSASANGIQTFVGDGASSFEAHHHQATNDAIIGSPIVTDGSTYQRAADVMTRTMLPKLGGTNKVTYSSDFSNAAWVWGTITPSSATSAITGGTAKKFDVTQTFSSVEQTVGTFSGSAETLYAILEQGTAAVSMVSLYNSTDSAVVARAKITWATEAITLDSGSGTVGGIKLSNSGPNGGKVYAVFVSGTGTSGKARKARIHPADTAATSGGTYFHHAQLVEGQSVAEWPIITTNAAGTTLADVPALAGMPEVWYEKTKVTAFVARETESYVVGSTAAVAIQGNVSTNELVLLASSAATGGYLYVHTGGAQQAYINTTGLPVGVIKHAVSASANLFKSSLNGASGTDDTSGSMPSVSRIGIGCYADGVTQPNQWIRQIGIAPITQTSAQLNALTA